MEREQFQIVYNKELPNYFNIFALFCIINEYESSISFGEAKQRFGYERCGNSN